MANHALVIGCDRYWNDASALEGAVGDALRVRSWLLHPERGAVPRQNLTLLLSATEHSGVPATLAEVARATRANIVRAVDTLLKVADGDEGTLYFYFAGHGLTAQADGFDEPCLLPSDFEPDYRDPALPIRALREQFATATLATQLLIVDACRDVPAGRAFRASGLADRRPRDYGRREPDQFVRFATSAGDVAYETGRGELAGGRFTAALLRGLHGAGTAKRWDPERERYVVRVRELFDYVRADLTRTGVARTQVPRAMDSYTEPNPVLVQFTDENVAPATLTVTVTPPDAAAITTISAMGPVEYDDRISRPPLANPLALALPPRTYTLRVRADGYVARRGGQMIDLYDDTAVELVLEPGEALRDMFGARPTRGFTPASLDEGSLVVAPDPSALLEAVDEAGRVRLGAGKLVLDRVGRYRLRVVEPHAAGPDLVAEVTDHLRATFRPSAPPLRPMFTEPVRSVDRLTIVRVDAMSVEVLELPPGPATITLADHGWRVAVYVPGLLVVDGPLVLSHPPEEDVDPRRRADRAQRFAAAGRIAEALAVLASGPAGIIGTALGGLLAARTGMAAADEVATAASTLRRLAPDLPDTAVLTAMAQTYDDPRARPVAPDLAAVPTLATGLATALRLYRGARVDPPGFLVRAAAGQLPGQPVTTWID